MPKECRPVFQVEGSPWWRLHAPTSPPPACWPRTRFFIRKPGMCYDLCCFPSLYVFICSVRCKNSIFNRAMAENQELERSRCKVQRGWRINMFQQYPPPQTYTPPPSIFETALAESTLRLSIPRLQWCTLPQSSPWSDSDYL